MFFLVEMGLPADVWVVSLVIDWRIPLVRDIVGTMDNGRVLTK